MTVMQNKMLSKIELLREQLNKQVVGNNICKDDRTLELSRKLDKLIYSYTEKYLKKP